MSLDFKLIEKSISYSIDILETSKIICPGLLHVTNFLHSDLLLKLQTFIFDDNLTWGFHDYHNDYHRSINTPALYRKKIDWIPDSVVEETHIVLDSLTDYLNRRFNKKNKFLGLSIYKDLSSLKLLMHTDNPVIDLSIQVYLNSNNQNLGTKFHLPQTIFQIPYKVNCGYLMDNNFKIIHSYDGFLDKNYYRYSLYAVWTNTNK